MDDFRVRRDQEFARAKSRFATWIAIAIVVVAIVGGCAACLMSQKWAVL